MANQPAPDIARPTVLIEADTVEDALARVSRELGPAARIVSADRVRRGGFAGFFAREVVELVAEVPDDGDLPQTAYSGEENEPTPDGLTGLDSAFARLLADAEAADLETTPSPAGSHLTEPRPQAGPTVRWNASLLLDFGLPERVVQCIADLDPTDDVAHITTLSAVFEAICGPVPEGPHRMIGSAGRHAGQTRGLPLPIHLVLDGPDLPEWLPSTPDIISWSRPAAAPRAIAMALYTGATLGWWQPCGSHRVRRVTPLDAAMALRELMERS